MSIYDEFMKTGNWSETQILLGIEFDFHCAYCDKNMLCCVDNHSEWQSDHIVPISKGGLDVIENLALSCRTCNFIKGRWDPSEGLGQQGAVKGDLISIARVRIFDRREQMQKDIDLYKGIVAKHG